MGKPLAALRHGIHTVGDQLEQTIDRPQSYAITVPAPVDALPQALREIARRYMSAQRIAGQSLLDSARCMVEAHAIAVHGQWQAFLDATGTSATQAKRLIAIHRAAEDNPVFAEAVRTDWLRFAVAADLAQGSTPPELVDTFLHGDEPPTRANVQRAKAALKSSTVDDLPSAPKPVPPAVHPDYAHQVAVERILKDATTPEQIQEAYTHARQTRDVMLYNKLMGMVDRAMDAAVNTPGPAPARPPAVPPRPRRPVSADISATIKYIDQIEAYASALEAFIMALQKQIGYA